MKFAAAAIIATLVAALSVYLWQTGGFELIADPARLRRWIGGLDMAGPAAIMVLLALAIVVSPIPSAPIALAAGAAYGHVWGTVYVLVGAEAGALIAFAIARLVGYEALRRRFGVRLSLGLLGSQTMLMAIVFATRLMPFVSFDMVSYAAGLTPLTWWRFAVATLLGILPASFALAHFGDEMATGDAQGIALAALALGLLTALPVAVGYLRDRRRTR